MLPDISSLKTRRLALQMTQKQFADLCNVSQSMIAKIESGATDPSYSIVKMIFERLEALESRDDIKVETDPVTKEFSVKASDAVKTTHESVIEYKRAPTMRFVIPSSSITTVTKQ